MKAWRVAARVLRSGLALWLAASLGILGSAALNNSRSDEPETPAESAYSGTSWGLGVVVPEGATLSGGGTLLWSAATNVTALLNIPDIVNATRTTYAILSLMTQDGSVIQVAAGIYPGNSTWLVYAMYISHVGAYPQTYHWVLNSSEPRMSPGDSVALSIFLSGTEDWSSKVKDLSTGSSVERSFGANALPTVKSGDQEVFALESYSTDEEMFEGMGNLTLTSLFFNGRPVAGGWYAYGDWDARHDPLFVVGGAAPPQFIAFSRPGSGTAAWYFVEGWNSGWQPLPMELVISTASVATAGFAVLIVWSFVRGTRSGHELDRPAA